MKTLQNPHCHFFLSSYATWVLTTPNRTLTQAVRMMNKEGNPYTIWYVPVAHDAGYEINFYAPQVDGAVAVEHIKPRKR